MENQIKLINKIILEALIDGSDGGGAYYSNEDGLKEALEDWISENNLMGYTVENVNIEKDGYGWYVLQIVKTK